MTPTSDSAAVGSYQDFLYAYAEYLDWPDRDIDVIARKLCEQYNYAPSTKDNPHGGREFLMIAFGWMWAKTDYIKANCECWLLMTKMNEMYEVVAKENHWND